MMPASCLPKTARLQVDFSNWDWSLQISDFRLAKNDTLTGIRAVPLSSLITVKPCVRSHWRAMRSMQLKFDVGLCWAQHLRNLFQTSSSKKEKICAADVGVGGHHFEGQRILVICCETCDKSTLSRSAKCAAQKNFRLNSWIAHANFEASVHFA